MLVATFVLTVVFDLVIAIEIGMVLAAILFMKRMADVTAVRTWTKLDSDNDDKFKLLPDGCCVFEFNGPMFFASSEKFTELPIDNDCRVMIIRMQNVPALDISAMRSLNALRKLCEDRGIALLFSHINSQPLSVMRRSKFFGEDESEFVLSNIDDALTKASEILSK